MQSYPKNFYDDMLAICKAIDAIDSPGGFPAWEFKFGVTSEMAIRGKRSDWRFEDERGGIHYFEFVDSKTLHYTNSVVENRDPPLILKPLPYEEIEAIVTALKEKLARKEPYEPYREDKRTIVSPLPGWAWRKKA